MSNKEEVRLEILAYLEKDEGMTRTSKKEYLQALMDKHFVLSDGDLILDKFDFSQIIATSKQIMGKITLPTSIGKFVVDAHEVSVVALIEATIQVLNSKGAFRKLPRFNK